MTENGKLTKQASLAIKGAGILLMLLHHYLDPNRVQVYDYTSLLFNTDQLQILRDATKVCVPVFVFVSGYGLYESYTRGKLNPGKRVFGLWKHFFPCFLVSVLLFALFRPQQFDDLSRFDWLCSALGISQMMNAEPLCTTWWYMSTAYTLVIFAPLLYYLLNRIDGLAYMGIALLLPGVLYIKYTGDSLLIDWLPAFALGALTNKYSLARFLHLKSWSWALAPLTLAIGFIGYQFLQNHGQREWALTFATAGVVITALCLAKAAWLNRLLVFFGRYSNPIFLLHTPLLLCFRGLMHLGHISIPLGWLTTLLCATLAAVLVQKLTDWSEPRLAKLVFRITAKWFPQLKRG